MVTGREGPGLSAAVTSSHGARGGKMAHGGMGFFSRIETAEHAQKVIGQAAQVAFVVAGLSAAGSILILVCSSGRCGPLRVVTNALYWNIGDVVLFTVLASFLRWRRSRAAAGVLLLVTVVEGAVTAIDVLGRTSWAERNLLVAIISLTAAVRAVQATRKLQALNTAAPM